MQVWALFIDDGLEFSDLLWCNGIFHREESPRVKGKALFLVHLLKAPIV